MAHLRPRLRDGHVVLSGAGRTVHTLAAAVCALAATFLVVLPAGPATAAGEVTCGPNETRVFVPPSKYICRSNGPAPTTPPPVDGGGNGEVVTPPTCNLSALEGHGYDNPSAPYCAENMTCLVVDLFAPVAMPDGEKPNEDSKPRVEICRGPLGGVIGIGNAFWSDDEPAPPTLLEQATEAIGNIDLGTATVNVSPPGRSLVNLDTWFWITGARQRVSGSSAFGLVAIATFRSLGVDPGDGSGTFRCDSFPTTAAEAEQSCRHQYRKASGRAGAYTVRVTSVYDLRFEVNGAQVEVQGAPATLDGPSATAPLRVVEAQTVVRPNR